MAESLRERLVEKKVYYPNCPGCKVELEKELQTGFPIRNLLRLWLIVLASALPISSLFPYLYFMIRDLNIAEREEDIGYYAGSVGCSLMLGRAVTSVVWGIIADRYGRKPVIIIGTVAVVIFNTLFGLSVNFWMAIASRFLLGGLNGLFGPIKAYACELFREDQQALALSTISTAWGLGLMIGPAIGGFLAQPAEKYPNIFSEDSFFGRFPYFLPCLPISLFALAVSISFFWLPETLHNHNGEENSNGDSTREIEKGSCCVAEENDKKNSKKSLFKNWPLMSAIIVNCVFSLHDMAYSEIFSLWAVSPKKFGGLSFSTEEVGEVLSISGLGLLAFQTFFFPYVSSLVGPVLVARIGGIITIPLLAVYPLIAMCSGLTLWLVLNIASVTKNLISTSIVTGTFLLQNRAVDQDQRGAANGLAMTGMSTFKAIGPAAGGALFSWAEKRLDASFLPGLKIVFFFLILVEILGVMMTFKPFLTVRAK